MPLKKQIKGNKKYKNTRNIKIKNRKKLQVNKLKNKNQEKTNLNSK